MRVRVPLVQAKAGECSGNGLGEHGMSLLYRTSGPSAMPWLARLGKPVRAEIPGVWVRVLGMSYADRFL